MKTRHILVSTVGAMLVCSVSGFMPQQWGLNAALQHQNRHTLLAAADGTFQSTDGRITRKQRRGDAIEFLEDDDGKNFDGGAVSGNVEDDPLVSVVQTIAGAADKRKAEAITALRVSHLTMTTEFFVNMVGNSRPQNQAIAAAIAEDMEENHGRKARPEGTADSGWILLDYGDIIVNIMTPRSREYYDIETFWKEGESLDLSGVLLPSGAVGPGLMGSVVDEGQTTSGDDDDLDVFWMGDEEEDLSMDGVAADATSGNDDDAELDPFWDLEDDDESLPAGPA